MAQEEAVEKPDNLNRALFTFIKKQKITDSDVREILTGEALKLKEKTNDGQLKVEIDEYIAYAASIKVPGGIPFDIDKVPKDLLKKFRVTEDKFDGITRIRHRRAYDATFEIMIRVRNGKALPYLFTTYSGRNWSFVESVTIMCGELKFDYKVENSDRDITTAGGIGVEENFSQSMDDTLLDVFRKVGDCENDVDVRFRGSEQNSDRKIRKKNLEAIRDAIALLDAAGS